MRSWADIVSGKRDVTPAPATALQTARNSTSQLQSTQTQPVPRVSSLLTSEDGVMFSLPDEPSSTLTEPKHDVPSGTEIGFVDTSAVLIDDISDINQLSGSQSGVTSPKNELPSEVAPTLATEGKGISTSTRLKEDLSPDELIGVPTPTVHEGSADSTSDGQVQNTPADSVKVDLPNTWDDPLNDPTGTRLEDLVKAREEEIETCKSRTEILSLDDNDDDEVSISGDGDHLSELLDKNNSLESENKRLKGDMSAMDVFVQATADDRDRKNSEIERLKKEKTDLEAIMAATNEQTPELRNTLLQNMISARDGEIKKLGEELRRDRAALKRLEAREAESVKVQHEIQELRQREDEFKHAREEVVRLEGVMHDHIRMIQEGFHREDGLNQREFMLQRAFSGILNTARLMAEAHQQYTAYHQQTAAYYQQRGAYYQKLIDQAIAGLAPQERPSQANSSAADSAAGVSGASGSVPDGTTATQTVASIISAANDAVDQAAARIARETEAAVDRAIEKITNAINEAASAKAALIVSQATGPASVDATVTTSSTPAPSMTDSETSTTHPRSNNGTETRDNPQASRTSLLDSRQRSHQSSRAAENPWSSHDVAADDRKIMEQNQRARDQLALSFGDFQPSTNDIYRAVGIGADGTRVGHETSTNVTRIIASGVESASPQVNFVTLPEQHELGLTELLSQKKAEEARAANNKSGSRIYSVEVPMVAGIVEKRGDSEERKRQGPVAVQATQPQPGDNADVGAEAQTNAQQYIPPGRRNKANHTKTADIQSEKASGPAAVASGAVGNGLNFAQAAAGGRNGTKPATVMTRAVSSGIKTFTRHNSFRVLEVSVKKENVAPLPYFGPEKAWADSDDEDGF